MKKSFSNIFSENFTISPPPHPCYKKDYRRSNNDYDK